MGARLAEDGAVINHVEAEIVVLPTNGSPYVPLFRPPKLREFYIGLGMPYGVIL
jgi:hypothetical protein